MLEIIVFLSGAVVMILELVGSRILAPSVGTSIYVWTSLISIILGSLSIGYWLGGKIADKNPSYKYLAIILFVAAIFVLVVVLIKATVFSVLQATISDLRLRAILAVLGLFSVPSVFLGMVAPYAVKLKLHAIKHSASTVGNLYAISTIGSIVGTLVTGFFLFSVMGSTKILIFLSLLLLIVSSLAYFKTLRLGKTILLIFTLFLFWRVDQISLQYEKNGFIEKDSAYNNIYIIDSKDQATRQPTRLLQMGRLMHSGTYLISNELLFEYTKYYDLAGSFNPDIEKVLMIGGGAYSYPKEFLRRYPNKQIDVVEIDPELTEIAKKYFGLKDDPRLSIYHEDGRIFLNQTTKQYDAILLDAFGHDYIPFHLATKESVEKTYDLLTSKGVVVTNIISSLKGPKSKVLQAQYKTYSSIFPHVYIFPVKSTAEAHESQNIILVAAKSKPQQIPQRHYLPNYKPDDPKLSVLTDDFAPLELYSLLLQ